MVHKLFLFSLLLIFISCREKNYKDLLDEKGLNEKEIKEAGFANPAKKDLLNRLTQLKADLPNMTEAQVKENIVQLSLRVNELYEKMYTVEKLSEVEYKNKFSSKDILRRLNELTKKYEALRKIGIKDPKSIPHHKNLLAIIDAYRDFGPMYFKETKTSTGGVKVKSVVSEKIPWSGYWYQLKHDFLYRDEDSPLGRLDALIEAVTGQPSGVRMSVEKQARDTATAAWEGLCDGWALASILTVEPKLLMVMDPKTGMPKKPLKPVEPLRSMEVEGVLFEARHLKGLYTLYHLHYPYKKYGFTYRGNKETDGAYQDINPEAFHKVVTKVIGEEYRAIVIDSVSGTEVWNKPMFAYNWSVMEDKEYPGSSFVVSGFAKMVKQRMSETNRETTASDYEGMTLDYRVFVDKNDYLEKTRVIKGKEVKERKYRVLLAEWLGDSCRNHPDNIKVPTLNQSSVPLNKEFKKYVGIFEKYLLKKI